MKLSKRRAKEENGYNDAKEKKQQPETTTCTAGTAVLLRNAAR